MMLKKIFMVIFTCVVMVPVSVMAIEHSGTSGTGGGGSTSIGGGSWQSNTVSVRVTLIDKNGDRLELKTDSGTYISKSIDFTSQNYTSIYGNLSRVSSDSSHSICTLSNGTTTLCSKAELKNGSGFYYDSDGSYTWQTWPYTSIASLPSGTDINSLWVAGSVKFDNYFAPFAYEENEDLAYDLFEKLIGVSFDYITSNSGSYCQENQEALAEAYLIYEPVSQIGNFVGTATELAILFGNDSSYNWRALPQIFRSVFYYPTDFKIKGLKTVTYAQGNMQPGTTSGASAVKQAASNPGLGYGMGVIKYDLTSMFGEQSLSCYNYSVDAACVNCNSDDEDNTAYIIQDITDWDAIFASKDSESSNVSGYYDKGNGVYCREEYTVYLPNVNNTIYVEPGRYFTLNASAAALEAVTSSSAIPNLKPIKVVKKRQCRVNSEENSSNATTVLNTFRANSESDFKSKTGTIYFKYTEDYDDSRYSMTEAEALETYDEDDNYTYSISNGTLTMEITKYYTLPANYYQYIRKQDGLSMKTTPSDNLSYYVNVGISNLPVSFNNTGGEESGSAYKAGDIQFSYELPGNNNDTDQYSLLYKAYITDNSYLDTGYESNNIYSKYINGEMEDGDETLLNNSACAKMYGVGTSGFTTCAKQRVNNAIGEGSNSCIVKNQIGSSSTSGYSCVVLTYGGTGDDDDGDGDDCSSEEDAESLGLDWDPYHQICCPVGTTYNAKLGKCATSSRDTGDDDDGDDDVCEIKDGKYYDFDGNEITKEEYDEICPADIPPICDSGCEYGCCPSGECAPMPGGVCPGSGGIDVVYRTIDLTYPFPGQNAEQRSTGTNWCSYNIQTQQIDCAYNNQTVTTYITDETVYDESHVLYEVTLDTSTINSIRSYNDSHAYDDWDLECLDNGQACISEFLRSVVDTTGNCANATKSTFYTCDD